MFEFIWGLKTVALFDAWTFEHILTGVSVGSSVKKNNQKHMSKFMKNVYNIMHPEKGMIRLDIIAVLFLAYLWETIEHYLETGLLGSTVQYWFQGVEFWPNRIFFDPLMLVLGYYVATKNPKLIWPARALSFMWLFVHIFIFPHSMYLHELF